MRQKHSGAWPEWPEEWRQPSDDALRRLRESHPDELGFHEFLQWNAERQLERCRDIARRRGMSIGLYLDTAVGVDGGGADAWMDQDVVLRGLSVGAPPDQFNPAGQDWGITAYNPHGLVARRFEPFRQMLRAAMRHAGAVRIDHVLGLMRLYVVPHGLGSAKGAYLRLPFADMLAVVAEESRRWNCITIGEDLGTVPEGFRDTLAAWGVWSYLVVMFERNGDGSFRRPEEYPERAIATFNTHDLATFTGWMTSHDLRIKHAINVDPGETEDDRHNSRVTLCSALAAATGSQRIGFEDVAAFLGATPTRLVSIAIEDVLGMEDQVNVPGTVTEHPNWRQRWPVLLEELSSDQRLRDIAATLARAGRGLPAILIERARVELESDLLDRVERRQAGLVAEMLDLVGRGVLGKAEMLRPAFERVLQIGIHIGAMKHVARAAGVANPHLRHRQRRKRADLAALVVPEHAALALGDAADLAAAALEIVEHRPRRLVHLLAEPFRHHRDIDEREQLVGVGPHAAAVERRQDSGLAAALRVGQRRIGLVAIEMQRAAARRDQGQETASGSDRRGSARWRACRCSA